MNMQKFGIFLLGVGICLVIYGCAELGQNHKSMPPGYSLVVNAEGRYVSLMPHGTVLDDVPYRGMSKQRAINRAWRQYEFGTPPVDPRERQWDPKNNSAVKLVEVGKD